MAELDIKNYKQLLDSFSEIDKFPKDIEFVNKRQLDVTEEAEHRYKNVGLPEIYTKEDIIKAFRDGVDFADQHPKNIWHDASEIPQVNYTSIIYQTAYHSIENVHITFIPTRLRSCKITPQSWNEFVKDANMKRWAYVAHILPKE